VYTELKTAADESCFQDCLDLFYSWSVTWQLAISSKKCCIATIDKLSDSWGKPKHCLGVDVSDTVSDHIYVLANISKKSLARLINEPT